MKNYDPSKMALMGTQKKHSQCDGPQPFKIDIPRKFSVLKGQQIQAYNLFTQ